MADTEAGLENTSTACIVTVTEQHLLLAVLQSPEALQLTAQYMTVDPGSAAEEALQNITAVVAAAADRAEVTADSSVDLQLFPGTLAAMNRALHITRRLGEIEKHSAYLCTATVGLKYNVGMALHQVGVSVCWFCGMLNVRPEVVCQESNAKPASPVLQAWLR